MIRKDFPKLGEHYFEERLPNGLLVRVMEKPGFAKRYAFVAADYGSIDAEFFLNGKKYVTPQGVAHYLEHKMFDLPEGNAMQEFAKYAGANNAFTSYTMTAYYVECTEHLEENFEILLRMVTTGYFTEESVQKERGIIAQEIKMYEDSADSAVMENLFRVMYQNHPVRNNIAGTVESIEDITADTLKLCHDAFYDPSNLIVCVIGDVDAASIIEQARPKCVIPMHYKVPGLTVDVAGAADFLKRMEGVEMIDGYELEINPMTPKVACFAKCMSSAN